MDIKKAILSQENIFNMLKKANNNHRLSHAYLFYGEKGTGKLEMAYALATLLYCPNGGCLECETCKNILNNNHLNVSYIGISDNKTMISKEQIKDIQIEFEKTSLVEGTRIYIIDGIDTASTAAQNSLLKFIEEPKEETPLIGIYLATNLSNVLPTIISRCETIHFNAMSISSRVSLLSDANVSVFDATLSSILTNNIDDALDFIKDESFETRKNLFLNLIDISNKTDAILFYVNNYKFYSDQKELTILFTWLIAFLKDAIIIINNNDNLILTALYDKINIYSKNNKDTLESKLELTLNLFNKLRYNVSAKNIFHELISNLI